jgi:hypothetical protein
MSSAHACSEIGLKWFLFALHDLGTALGFVSVLDFSGDFVFLEYRRDGQTGIKTIFDHFRNTHARRSILFTHKIFNTRKSLVWKQPCSVQYCVDPLITLLMSTRATHHPAMQHGSIVATPAPSHFMFHALPRTSRLMFNAH